MSLQDEFHNDMTVETRNGSVIKGLHFDGNGSIVLVGEDGTSDATWCPNGGFWGELGSPLDIVKVLPKPKPKLVKDVELRAGMFVRKPAGKTFKVLCIHEHVVWMCLEGQRPGTVSARAIKDWEVVDGW